MADGLNSTVTIAPSDGERVRGMAGGIGGHSDLADAERSELFAARRTGSVGLVHSWELVTAVDGPGTRMTLFLSGCPLRCVYCHNPDTMDMKEGTLEDVEAIIKKIKRYRPVFNASGGGLTISGGEPLFQIAFTRRILESVHAAGIHTAIDTSGFLGARLTDEDIDNIDLFLLDVKSGFPETYKRVTSHDLQPTLDFGERLTKLGKKIWIRFVLVPGWTDSPENIERVAQIVSRWKTSVERVEVLPFHNMGADKWKNLDMEYKLEGVKPPSNEAVEAARDVFRSYGLNTF
ncbi:MAG: pyruvate formate-lyase-activating protein [Corynebacterium glucuronolyticum]|nr:pyruvate formate-lyase-activating protein [Corynebacterium glucuronolyticum]MDD7587063.1 pyruvate formate-lyase-activating protein [Mycobacteriaceae bacterium]MDY5835064.1 pyruvate formate-lyase-activating protein [Corynebacterium glucuronolyticum]